MKVFANCGLLATTTQQAHPAFARTFVGPDRSQSGRPSGRGWAAYRGPFSLVSAIAFPAGNGRITIPSKKDSDRNLI